MKLIFPKVDVPHPINGRPKQNKRLNRGNTSCPILCTRMYTFPAFRLRQIHKFFLDLEFSSFWSGTYTSGSSGSQAFGLRMELYIISSPGSPAGKLKIFVFLSFHNSSTNS
jgi:hypothetical protein